MKKVTAYVHTHWDREWYREFEDFRLRLIEVFDEVLEALNSKELPCFYFDGQTAALEDYLAIRSEKTEEIKKLIKEKKLRIGPFYCSSDSFLVSGESIYKNLEIGIKTSKEFGETDFIGYLSDTFGHSQAIPYILKAFGIDKACLWRGLGNLPSDLDWDGIKVTNLIQGYFQDFLNLNIPIENKAELLKKYIDKISQKSEENVLLAVGADHLAIPKNIKKQIQELNKIYKEYKIEVATPFEYFEKIIKRKKVSGEFLENTKNFILPGVYSSRLYVKQANAKNQWQLNKLAEPIQALSHFYFNGKNKQNEIDYAYKTLIKNHAHDSIYGCNIDMVQKEVMTRYEKVNTISNGIIKRTLRDISGEIPAVINLSNYEYSGKINIITENKLPKWMKAKKISTKKGFTDKKLYNINEIPITEDFTSINEYIIDVKNIKPFSITAITKENICKDKYINTDKNFIENKYIKIEVKNGKIIFTDKVKNEQYKDFITITDRKDNGDSYNFGAVKNDKPIVAKLLSFKIKENNLQSAVITLKYKLKTTININITLYNQSEYAEFKTEWLNKDKNHILQIGFNLKEKITQTINEDLYGTVKRTFNPDFDIYKLIPAQRGVEIKPNTSPMQRFMNTQNFTLITKGLTEYEIIKNTVNLTLLRATGIISNPHNPTRGTPAGPPLITENLQCLGKNNAEFAVAFNNKEADLFRLADEFYCTNLSFFTNQKDTIFFENSNKNIQITAIQITKNGLQLRLFNNSDKEQITVINANEVKSVEAKLKPKEIKNVLIHKVKP